MTNLHTNRRIQFAERIAKAVYVGNPKVVSVAISGSVGRGWADAYSDIELDVYWQEPPTDAERLAAIEGVNGRILMFEPFQDDEWSEDYLVGDMQMDLSHFLVRTIDQYLDDVLLRFDTAVLKQLRHSALVESTPLHGHQQITEWQQRVAPYPDGLREAMIKKYLLAGRLGIWYLRETLLAREDYFMLTNVFNEMLTAVLGGLLALNRHYIGHPGFKWSTKVADELPIKPPNFGQRLQAIYRLPPEKAVSILHTLLLETLDLMEAESGIDLEPTRTAVLRLRTPV